MLCGVYDSDKVRTENVYKRGLVYNEPILVRKNVEGT